MDFEGNEKGPNNAARAVELEFVPDEYRFATAGSEQTQIIDTTFSSVDLINRYVLNNIATGANASPAYMAAVEAPANMSSVSTFPLNDLGPMSSMFATTTGEESATSTEQPTSNERRKMLKALWESKLPAACTTTTVHNQGNITRAAPQAAMAPLSHSVGNQESTSRSHVAEAAVAPLSRSVGKQESTSRTPVAAYNYIDDEVNENDVLMGRGGRSNHHPGNVRYLRAKLNIRPRYCVASKDEKTGIAEELVNTVRDWGGRFLKLDEDTQRWYEVDNVTARKKASQTLREENTPESRARKRAKYNRSRNSRP